LSGNPSDGSSYSAVYGFVIKSWNIFYITNICYGHHRERFIYQYFQSKFMFWRKSYYKCPLYRSFQQYFSLSFILRLCFIGAARAYTSRWK
jgi:hypothetical protein